MAKVNNNRPATAKDVKKIVRESNLSLSKKLLKEVNGVVMDASHAILEGVERMFKEQDGRNEKNLLLKRT